MSWQLVISDQSSQTAYWKFFLFTKGLGGPTGCFTGTQQLSSYEILAIMVRCRGNVTAQPSNCGKHKLSPALNAISVVSFNAYVNSRKSRNSWNCFTLFIFIDIILFELLVSFLMHCISIMWLRYIESFVIKACWFCRV